MDINGTGTMIVTTAYDPSPQMEEVAIYLAECLAIQYAPRAKDSLATLQKKHETTYLVVVTQKGPVVTSGEGEYFFHLNMAEMRINNIQNGKNDHMIDAMGLRNGMTVLDCTLGMATDAIVASYVVGDTGKVVGLEISKIISTITAYGLQTFHCERLSIQSALRAIEVTCIDSLTYLTALPDQSFDVVYFDPMFRHPLHRSSNVQPLRLFADKRPIDESMLEQAVRVARKRVVVKETRNSREFQRFGFREFYGGNYSRIQYGVIFLESREEG